jgi:hypothetical protein
MDLSRHRSSNRPRDRDQGQSRHSRECQEDLVAIRVDDQDDERPSNARCPFTIVTSRHEANDGEVDGAEAHATNEDRSEECCPTRREGRECEAEREHCKCRREHAVANEFPRRPPTDQHTNDGCEVDAQREASGGD